MQTALTETEHADRALSNPAAFGEDGVSYSIRGANNAERTDKPL